MLNGLSKNVRKTILKSGCGGGVEAPSLNHIECGKLEENTTSQDVLYATVSCWFGQETPGNRPLIVVRGFYAGSLYCQKGLLLTMKYA